MASVQHLSVCMLTPGQPSNNPRLVKEADLLAKAGYRVHVICTDCGLWPSQMDGALLARSSWTCEYVGGIASRQRLKHRFTRLRYACANRVLRVHPGSHHLRRWTSSRAFPEMERAALRHQCDLFIAHHVTVLPIAVRAARNSGAKVGYDAEDFYTGMRPNSEPPSLQDRILEEVERDHIGACDYVTTASPSFADAYVEKYRVQRPVPILNVFPLADRPLS